MKCARRHRGSRTRETLFRRLTGGGHVHPRLENFWRATNSRLRGQWRSTGALFRTILTAETPVRLHFVRDIKRRRVGCADLRGPRRETAGEFRPCRSTNTAVPAEPCASLQAALNKHYTRPMIISGARPTAESFPLAAAPSAIRAFEFSSRDFGADGASGDG